MAEKLLNQAEIFDGECWRNETYNGRRFSWDKGYVLPAQGRLDLDMVHLEPNEVERYGEMQEADFTSLLKVLRNQRSSSSRLALIRKMTAQYIFTAERASQVHAYGPFGVFVNKKAHLTVTARPASKM